MNFVNCMFCLLAVYTSFCKLRMSSAFTMKRENEDEMVSDAWADDIMVDRWNGVPLGCLSKPADIYLVLDTAADTSDESVQQQQKFLSDLVVLFPLSKQGIRVGVISFGHRPLLTAPLGRADTVTELRAALQSVQRVGGVRDTAQVLRYLRQKAFAPRVARKEVAHVVILMTSGHSAHAQQTVLAADLLRALGVYVYVVSDPPSPEVDKEELLEVASRPAHKFLYDASGYDIITSLIDILHVKECNYQVLPPINSAAPLCTSRRPTDVAFVVEHLGLGGPKTQRLLSFILGMLSEVDPASDIRATIVTSKDPIPRKALLSKVDTIQNLEQRLGRVTFPDLGSLLKRARLTLGQRAQGGQDVQKIAVVFVDESVELGQHTLAEARANKRDKLDTYVVVLGDLAKPAHRDNVQLLASGADHVIHLDSFDDLESQTVIRKTLTTLCTGL